MGATLAFLIFYCKNCCDVIEQGLKDGGISPSARSITLWPPPVFCSSCVTAWSTPARTGHHSSCWWASAHYLWREGSAKERNFSLLSSFDATARQWALTDASFNDASEACYSPSQRWTGIRIIGRGLWKHRLPGPAPLEVLTLYIGVGPKNVHFSQVLWSCWWCCWSEDHRSAVMGGRTGKGHHVRQPIEPKQSPGMCPKNVPGDLAVPSKSKSGTPEAAF